MSKLKHRQQAIRASGRPCLSANLVKIMCKIMMLWSYLALRSDRIIIVNGVVSPAEPDRKCSIVTTGRIAPDQSSPV